MQKLITEGFESGISKLTAADARNMARREAGLDDGV
jgi:hypothetical protein